MVADNFESSDGSGAQPSIVQVAFQTAGHLHGYLCDGLALKRGDRVMVETDAGNRIGTVVVEPHEASQTLDLSSFRAVIRIAGDADFGSEDEALDLEANARRICLHRILERNLPVKLVNVRHALDGRKAVFYFVSAQKPDLRDLIRDLANTLHVRIETKLIGAREETKVTGAMGPCGRELCCSSWLREFEPITIKMAREQGLALNPSRLAGMCGRLKCCLRYEFATYVELKQGLPPVGRRVASVKGDGKVVRQNILKQTVLIEREEDGGVVEATLGDLVTERPQ